MILKIILLIIIFQLCLERFREGMENSFDIEPPPLGPDCYGDINILFPVYDKERKLYTNKNRYLRNNRENIVTYATNPCV
jgi:hypothetical protein